MPAPLLAEVALFTPPYTTLSYALPPYLPESSWTIGLRVAVPLGKGIRSGIITAISKDTDPNKKFVVKSLLWPLETKPILKSWYLELAKQMSLRHTVTPGQILANILPAGLRTTQVRLRFWSGKNPEEIKLPQLRTLSDEKLKEKGILWQQGLGDFSQKGNASKENELCSLLKDAPWPVRPSAKTQIALLEYLLEHGTVTRKRIMYDLGKKSATTLSLLIERGLIGVRPEESMHSIAPSSTLTFDAKEDTTKNERSILVESEPPLDPSLMHHVADEEPFIFSDVCEQDFTLSSNQQKVFDDLLLALKSHQASSHLLFGVTGSGKTAIYLKLARESLAMGKSVLLLAPEVALALKLFHDVKNTLPSAPLHLFHGYLPVSAKEKTFRLLPEKKGPIICVGTRSALFLPIENIGLIVLDEEHDGSFKQDEGFTYQAKEIAWYRAGKENALLLMGSATPDIKTFHAALEKKIPLHTMNERVGGGELPKVEIVVLPKNQKNTPLLAQPTIEALTAVIEAGQQAVILLNRRGYAPLMYCLNCGTVAKCPHCDIGLAYHKGRERLVCHYCGYGVPFPSPCTSCQNMNFLPMGDGTEKLEELLPSLLPLGTKILRLDKDSTRRPGRMEEILASFARKEASILVGTQMLSKGHHFPEVTLAVIADADLGLNLPDYRAAERTFQLLVQSSGRSGRGEKKGRVIIQTRDPSHYCWGFVQTADYEGFYKQEITLREKRNYPPFIHLALMRISYSMIKGKTDKAQEELSTLANELRKKGKELGVVVLGPAPAPLSFLKGRKRFHCLVKCSDWLKIRLLYTSVKQVMKNSQLRISLDLDPVNML